MQDNVAVLPDPACALRDATCWAVKNPPKDAAVAALFNRLANKPPADWTFKDAASAYQALTGPARRHFEEAGWDVDLLPGVPGSPEGTLMDPGAPSSGSRPARPDDPGSQPLPSDSAQPGIGQVYLQHTPDGRATLHTPIGHPLRESTRHLPGAYWNGENQAWTLPITRRTALALRVHLTGHKPTLTPDLAAALRTAADSPATPDITLHSDQIHLKFEHTSALQEAMQRILQARWNGPEKRWEAPADKAEQVIKIARDHNLLADEQVTALAEQASAPFDYDGTIDGLRGVPLSELRTVRAQPAKGKTPSLEDRLIAYNIHNIADLLGTIPLRYMDRNAITPLNRLTVGEKHGVLGHVTRMGKYDRAKRLLRLTVHDGSAELSVTFFNMPWLQWRFKAGDEVVLFGRLDVWEGSGRRSLQMSNPIMDPTGEGTSLIVPVYPQSEKSQVTTWDLHSAAMEAVSRLGDLQDPLPAETVFRHNLTTRADAYRQVHHPDSVDQAAHARTRLAFDELLRMQLALGMRRHATAHETGVTHNPTGALTRPFLDALPFPLTGAQTRALKEISANLRQPYPMHRLLQGDVGSGKTLIALLALLSGIEGGFQGALMAPTEILASQLHFEAAERLADLTHPDGRPLTVRFLGGKTRKKERTEIITGLADGTIDLIVGTHALISEGVNFANLGLVVVDEQHRFGVEQRAALRDKGPHGTPDMLIMTATPIPRSAAMVHFGDLEVSILDELPPGRTPIVTTWDSSDPALDTITGPPWDLVRDQVEAGRQAYIVASLVEDNERIAAESAEAAYALLQDGALAGLRLGMVHGKQDRALREDTMRAFKDGDLDVLVATTVIEVGVNVPNATVMVVLNAPRFGIAQLHQIRGRVGRGGHASYCVLTGKAGSADGVARMQALVASTDGFFLSEVDLELRGAGSIFGARQAGQSDLRVADLNTDKELLAMCRDEATTLLFNDHALNRRPGLRAEVTAALGEGAADWLGKS